MDRDAGQLIEDLGSTLDDLVDEVAIILLDYGDELDEYPPNAAGEIDDATYQAILARGRTVLLAALSDDLRARVSQLLGLATG